MSFGSLLEWPSLAAALESPFGWAGASRSTHFLLSGACWLLLLLTPVHAPEIAVQHCFGAAAPGVHCPASGRYAHKHDISIQHSSWSSDGIVALKEPEFPYLQACHAAAPGAQYRRVPVLHQLLLGVLRRLQLQLVHGRQRRNTDAQQHRSGGPALQAAPLP
eukprot:1012150-Pelagomonas_calceolata.AAC.2